MNEHLQAINDALPQVKVGDTRDNAICFTNDVDWAVVDFSQQRYITKIRKLAEEYPEECVITHENKDGSLVARVPKKWVKVSPPRQLTDEQKAQAAERLRKARQDMSTRPTT